MKSIKNRPPSEKTKGRSLFFKASRLFCTLALMTSAAVLISVLTFDAIDDFLALTDNGKTKVPVTVTDISQLPEKLHSAGVIRHPMLFRWYLSSKDATLKRETTSVSDRMDYRALLAAFTEEETVRTVRITVPKRTSADEIIDIFISHGIGSREGFAKAINEYDYEFDFIKNIPGGERSYRLEGYLYPDTYDFYTGQPESYYINKMLERFNNVIAPLEPLCKEHGISLDHALTVASLIECSCEYPSGYEGMSSLINNRLKNDMPLEIPASSVYGISGRVSLFTGRADDELALADSPYNTFKIKGLPPGAICSPTTDAVMCAILPVESQYMYFVTRHNGTVLFAETKEQHLKNLDSL